MVSYGRVLQTSLAWGNLVALARMIHCLTYWYLLIPASHTYSYNIGKCTWSWSHYVLTANQPTPYWYFHTLPPALCTTCHIATILANVCRFRSLFTIRDPPSLPSADIWYMNQPLMTVGWIVHHDISCCISSYYYWSRLPYCSETCCHHLWPWLPLIKLLTTSLSRNVWVHIVLRGGIGRKSPECQSNSLVLFNNS